MAISIPAPLVELILLGPLDDRRQLQDSPILGDVWVAFGKNPSKRLDLLIAPYKGQHAGSVAGKIDEGLEQDSDLANIAFLQGLIVARLTFAEVMQVVAPKTSWWIKRWKKEDTAETHEATAYTEDRVKSLLKDILELDETGHLTKTANRRLQALPSIERFLVLTALILWAGTHETPRKKLPTTDSQIVYILKQANAELEQMYPLLTAVAEKMLKDPTRELLVWQVSLNRTAMPAISRSVPAVKADAATTLFKVNCSDIGWAVIDSGIDGAHPAFHDAEGKSRVKRSFDFKDFRKIVSLSNSKETIRKKNAAALMSSKERMASPPSDEAEAAQYLERLAEDARSRGPVHWELVTKFVEIKPDVEPETNHGTHVAGIIGASKEAAVKTAGRTDPDFADGMCPDISLYDFRVLGPDLIDTEFAIIAALQFIRHLNSRDNFLTVHGANLSLSIPHDVRNFACGRTPICDECERLVSSGVVVVAAAGNHGYKSFEIKDGSYYDGYAAFSITDPGNADSVLTVGATHRFWPHTYGVSFFSSRGPTGDGRMKPDLVAPGERIRAPFHGGRPEDGGAWGDLDGTSMAAPHVSGAAAMLMARYSELVGQPLRIKRILCQSATDLGRERSFQGNGMLDVLRAFQAI
jgi:serine protease AprX